MKRFIALCCLVAALLCLFSGCAKELEPIEKAQARAVEIGRQYLDFELTEAEAKEKLDSIKVPETSGNGQLYLDVDIGYLSFIIGKNDATYEDVKYEVDKIESRDYTE